MNVLKALAKMTKIASGLQDNWDYSLRELETLREKYDDTVGVATERYDLIKSLEAKLYAAEQKAATCMHFEAVGKLNALGYCWDQPGGRWVDPVPAAPSKPSLRVASAEKKLGELGYSWFNDQWVGAKPTEWKVLEIRPVVPTASPPIFADHVGAKLYPPRPEGTGWRPGSKPPRDMGLRVELLFTDGVGHKSGVAGSVEWAAVAWWRFAE